MIRRLLAVLLILVLPAAARAEEPERWYPVESPTTEGLLAVHFSPDGAGFAVGEGGAVLRYDSGTFRLVPGPGGPVRFRFLATVGPDELWATADGSSLYHYAAGAWTLTPLDSDADIMSIAFLGPRLGYAAGLFGVLYRYDGERWERLRAPVLSNDRESHLVSVALLAPDDVWVGGQAGFVLHFDGHEWQRLTPRKPGEGGRLRRVGDTIALIDAPALIRRGGAFHPLAPVAVLEIAEHGGSIWGTGWDGNLYRLAPSGGTSIRPPQPLGSIAAGPDGLWAVGHRGLVMHLERGRLPTFEDQTFEAGVGVLSESGIAYFADLDGSGQEDLVLAPFGRNSFLRAEERFAFRSQPLASPPLSALPNTSAVAIADMDGDGQVDLLVRPPGREGAPPWHLLRNLGAFQFTFAGPFTGTLSPQDVSGHGDLDVADYDGDGDLDVYEARFLAMPLGQQIPNVLYRNDGLGRFQEEALSHYDGGASLAWTDSVLSADLDGDGRTDLLTVNAWSKGNLFFRQAEDGTWIDATPSSGLAGADQHAADAAAGDVNGDGALDVLVVTTLPFGPSRLYRNDGRGHFRDVTSASGLAEAFATATRAVFADMDLDGDLDLVVSNTQPRNPAGLTSPPPIVRLFLNDGRGSFTDVTIKAGLGLQATDVLVEDFDADGDLDIYFVRNGESNRLLVNQAPPGGWLKVAPRASPPNRAALGARVSVYGPDGALLGVRETSWRRPIAHFGLGDAERVSVEVRFPGGRTARREGVTKNQAVLVAERSAPVLWASEAAFFVRHRLAWMDKKREGIKFAAALALALLVWRGGPRLGGRRISPRAKVPAGLLILYGSLSIAAMPLAPVSLAADALPLSILFALGLSLFLLDRAWTRQVEARFVGQYEILTALGQGGMGIVYKARDRALADRPIVALKVLRPERVADPASLRRFVREAELGARLNHPGIARVLGSGECRILVGRTWHTTAYLAMEPIEGLSLAARLSEGEPLPLARAVEIARDAAEALAAAHAAGVLHRDIKPDNLLLSRDGAVKIVDFGIAAVARSSERTDAGLLVGTLAYMPPERVEGRPEDARGDLYALGAVLYEAVCGRRPFEGKRDVASLLRAIVAEVPAPPYSLREGIPPRLSALIMALLAKDPASRPASAGEVVKALQAVLHELRGEAPVESVRTPPEVVLEARKAPPPLPRLPDPEAERVTLELPPPGSVNG
jgi:serine/threonine protein kinase